MRELRADVAVRCSLLQHYLLTLTHDDVKEMNQLVKHMKETADLGILVWSIPFEELLWVSVSDVYTTALKVNPKMRIRCWLPRVEHPKEYDSRLAELRGTVQGGLVWSILLRMRKRSL
ncbi:unnamed protein product [Prorocentrum cordatum]|uniref:Uncharacterized protein n=1 Tax=Prorocentrum cordatum TaxID=2364126 RepID=A0ABN9TQL8_9DINO|nr:unnamed protein product [Polarella glacialis]